MENVLLVGQDFRAASTLIERLKQWRCQYQVANTYEQARELLDSHRFDVVLSKTQLPDAREVRLIEDLDGFSVSLFFYLLFEKSCLWLPAMDRGRNCWGTCSLTPSEFARVLQDLVTSLQHHNGRANPEHPVMRSAAETLVATIERVLRPRRGRQNGIRS